LYENIRRKLERGIKKGSKIIPAASNDGGAFLRGGKCIKIVIGEYTGVNAAFLLQNMFPVLPKYIDHIH